AADQTPEARLKVSAWEIPIVSWNCPTAVQFPALGQLTDVATAFGTGPASIETGKATATGVELVAHAAPIGMPTATTVPTALERRMVVNFRMGGEPRRLRPDDIDSPISRGERAVRM